MLLTLANYNNDNRKFLSAVSQQYEVSHTLDSLAKDIRYSSGNAKEKIDAVGVYEKRLMTLQKQVKDGIPKTHDADKDVDSSIKSAFARDVKTEFGRCLKCNEKFVKSLLLQHTIYCSAAGDNDKDKEKEVSERASFAL